jgi:hypothetical protein
MTNLKIKKSENHTYKVITSESLLPNIYPTVHMEITEEASLEDHIYAFERFLQSIGFVLPENCHLDFVENEPEVREIEGLKIIEGEDNSKKNGVN